MIKGIFLDLDNTLINSKKAYKFSLEKVEELYKPYFIGNYNFLEEFEFHKKIVKDQLPNVPTNRNRLLVFKLMSDKGLLISSPKKLLEMEEAYFHFFEEEIRSQLKVYQTEYQALFEILKSHSLEKKIILLSNESLRTQLRKLSWFFPDDIPYRLITSEEIGVEKPSPIIFQRALDECNLQPENAVMVGDSYEDDFLGAKNLGIQIYLLRDIFGENIIKENIIKDQALFEAFNLTYLLKTFS